MKKALATITLVLLYLPVSILAEDKEHGGFMFRFIGSGGGGASNETNISGGQSTRSGISELVHDYRVDFGYSFTDYFALHIGLWWRYIHVGQNLPIQQFSGIPIGVTFFLPSNWYISPTLIYDVKHSNVGVIQGTFDSAAAAAAAGARSAALAGGVRGALTGTTARIRGAGLPDALVSDAAILAGLNAGATAAAAGLTGAALSGAIQGVLGEAGVTNPAALAGAVAAIAMASGPIGTAANTAPGAARSGLYGANSRYVDSNGVATTHAAFRPRGLSYGLEIGWETPVTKDWGFGVGIRYWRIFTEYDLAINSPVPGQAPINLHFDSRDDLFNITFTSTYN